MYVSEILRSYLDAVFSGDYTEYIKEHLDFDISVRPALLRQMLEAFYHCVCAHLDAIIEHYQYATTLTSKMPMGSIYAVIKEPYLTLLDDLGIPKVHQLQKKTDLINLAQLLGIGYYEDGMWQLSAEMFFYFKYEQKDISKTKIRFFLINSNSRYGAGILLLYDYLKYNLAQGREFTSEFLSQLTYAENSLVPPIRLGDACLERELTPTLFGMNILEQIDSSISSSPLATEEDNDEEETDIEIEEEYQRVSEEIEEIRHDLDADTDIETENVSKKKMTQPKRIHTRKNKSSYRFYSKEKIQACATSYLAELKAEKINMDLHEFIENLDRQYNGFAVSMLRHFCAPKDLITVLGLDVENVRLYI